MGEKFISLNGARDFKALVFFHESCQTSMDVINKMSPIIAKAKEHSPVKFPFVKYENTHEDDSLLDLTRVKIEYNAQLWFPPELENKNAPDPLKEFVDLSTGKFLYPIYIGSFSPPVQKKPEKTLKHKRLVKKYIFLASPFYRLFNFMKNYLEFKGEEIIYFKVAQLDVINDLFLKKEKFPFFRITLYQGEPSDEPLIGSCRVIARRTKTKKAGEEEEEPTIGNLVDTQLFKYFRECNVYPTLLRIKFDNFEGQRLSILSDAFGNYKFYMRKEGLNLLYFNLVFTHLLSNGWIEATTTDPTLRAQEEFIS